VQTLMLEQAQTAEPPLIVLDLAETAYMGSAFIETISRTWKRVNARSGQLVLCSLTPFCAEVLRATRLDTLWKHYPTRGDAIAALAQAAA
jgi:anti-anti-sigma factor